MVAYKYKSDDTRTREREKGHPIASATSLLGEYAAQRRKEGAQRIRAAFVPHSIQWLSGRKRTNTGG